MSEIIVDHTQVRSFEQLSQKEKKLVESMLSSLDYINPVSVIQFGSEDSEEVTSISTKMILKFKVKDFQDVQVLITSFMEDLKKLNIETLLQAKKRGTLFKFPFGRKKEQKRVISLLTQQILIEKSIDELEDNLMTAKLAFLGDMYFCSEMIKKTYEYAYNQEIEYVTIQEALKKANNEKQNIEELHRQNPNNIEYSYKISDLNRAIKHLEVKAYNLLAFRTAILQSVFQIGLIQRADELMVSKIDDTIKSVIPAWKRKFAIAIATYRLNNAVTIQKVVDETTNKLLIQNSQMFIDTMLGSVEGMGSPYIDVEILQKANEDLKQTFNGFTEVEEQVEQARKNAVRTMQNIHALALKLQSKTSLQQLEERNGV